MSSLSMPRLSIVIVTHNSRADIDACLGSIALAAASVDHEIVVVDNASSDGTAAAVRERWPGVRVIDAGGNLGFAAANNIGIRQTFGDLIVLLNPDTVPRPRSLDRMAVLLEDRPDAAVVGPRLVDGSGRAELSFGWMISPLAELRQKLLVRGHAAGLPILSAYVEWLTRRERQVDWVSGACLMVRRADAEAVGLLDERYFMYTEDVDFCAAVRARGRKVLFTPSAHVVHMRGQSAIGAAGPTQAAYRRSQLAFYAKHHPAWVPVLRAYLRLLGR
jgi:N-acetylglucosaminyl-diphospho-decaprenol L-rhamnosyltransferase